MIATTMMRTIVTTSHAIMSRFLALHTFRKVPKDLVDERQDNLAKLEDTVYKPFPCGVDLFLGSRGVRRAVSPQSDPAVLSLSIPCEAAEVLFQLLPPLEESVVDRSAVESAKAQVDPKLSVWDVECGAVDDVGVSSPEGSVSSYEPPVFAGGDDWYILLLQSFDDWFVKLAGEGGKGLPSGGGIRLVAVGVAR